MPLSSDFRELVRSRCDIVSLIGESVTLIPERGGAEYKCLCPFHDDHNPSMRVYPERQSFRCWSCNEGGDIFTWTMKRDNVPFPEALEILAHRVHLEVPKRSAKEAQEASFRADVFDVLSWAEGVFHDYLMKSPDAQIARDYLRGRGYTEQTLQQWRLGFSPDDWTWLSRQAGAKFSDAELVEARLSKERDGKSGCYDFFRGRVLFPIRDEQSRVVSFGGRLVPGVGSPDGQKYLNTADSPVFHKSKILFGLPAARPTIGQEKSVLVVEGYADCVACHQHGVKNVVATLGTALTESHCARLKLFAPHVVLLYDSDEPGQNAAAKSVGMLLGQSVDLRVLTLPSGKDPDEYLKTHSADSLRELAKQAPEAWEFRLNWEIRKHGRDSINSRELILTEMLNLLASIPKFEGSPRESIVLGRIASKLRLSEPEVRAQLQRVRSEQAPQSFRPISRDKPAEPQRVITFYRRPLSKDDKLDVELLEILLVRPELAVRTRTQIGEDDVLNPDLRELLQMIYDLVDHEELPTFERIMLQTEKNELKSLLVWLENQARTKGIEQKLLDAVDGVPKFYLQNLDHLKWRREKLSHEAYLDREALSPEQEDPLARLKKASTFHKKRNTDRRQGFGES